MSISLIKNIRSITGLPLKDISKAISELGDSASEEDIIKHLRKQGVLKQAARQDRETNQGKIFAYTHEGRIGVLLEVKSETDFVSRSDDFSELGKNLTLHIAAFQPKFVSPDEVSEEFIANEIEIAKSLLEKEGKPADKIAMILDGKRSKIVSEVSLLSQQYLMDNSITVQNYVDQIGQKTGEKITVSKFIIFNLNS